MESCCMKLPIERIPGSIPPRFVYEQKVTLPQGPVHVMQYETTVPIAIEAALCELLAIAHELARENRKLKQEAL